MSGSHADIWPSSGSRDREEPESCVKAFAMFEILHSLILSKKICSGQTQNSEASIIRLPDDGQMSAWLPDICQSENYGNWLFTPLHMGKTLVLLVFQGKNNDFKINSENFYLLSQFRQNGAI